MNAILVDIQGIRGREPFQVEGHPSEVGGPRVVGGGGAVLAVCGVGHVAGGERRVGDVTEEQVEVTVAVEFEQGGGSAGMAREGRQLARLPAGAVDVEAAGVVVSNEQPVVLRGLVEHSVAPVRDVPDQGVSATDGAFGRAPTRVGVQGGRCLGPRDHVEVAIAIEIAQGGDVGVEADEGQLLVAGSEVPVAEEVGGRGVGIVNQPVLHRADPQPDAALAVVEDVGNAVAVGIAEQHPVLHAFREGGPPVRSVEVGHRVFGHIREAPLERQDAVSVAVKDEQVLDPIPVEVGRRELRGREAPGPRVVERRTRLPEDRQRVPTAERREVLRRGQIRTKAQDGEQEDRALHSPQFQAMASTMPTTGTTKP